MHQTWPVSKGGWTMRLAGLVFIMAYPALIFLIKPVKSQNFAKKQQRHPEFGTIRVPL
jgi:hypothetical protein